MPYDADNIFAKILRGDIPSKPVYEDDHVLAIRDISPAAPVHVLVLPKGEYTSFNDFSQNAPTEEMRAFFTAVQKIAAQEGLEDDGYRLIANHGSNASQTVPHFHMHVLGGRTLGGLVDGDYKTR